MKDELVIQHFIKGNNYNRVRSRKLFSMNEYLFSSEQESDLDILNLDILRIPNSKSESDMLIAIRYEDCFVISEITPELTIYNKLHPLLLSYLKKYRFFEISIFDLNKLIDDRYKDMKKYIEIINSRI